MSSHLKLSYSDHAAARTFDRCIFRKQVTRTLRRPDRTYTRGAYRVAEYTTTSQVLIRAVYHLAPGEDVPVVVSAVRLGKLNDGCQRSEFGTYLNREFDVAYVALLQGKLAETIEVGDGIYCDLDSSGEIMGVEVFDFSRRESIEEDLATILKRSTLAPAVEARR